MEGKCGLELPLANMTDVKTVGKSDLVVRFDTGLRGTKAFGFDALDEIRLSMPAAGSPGEMSADQLRGEIERLTASGDKSAEVASIPDVKFVNPRGQHTLEFYPTHLKMHGKSQSYTLKWRTQVPKKTVVGSLAFA
eukprot:6398534-Amphidinium_carterae.1